MKKSKSGEEFSKTIITSFGLRLRVTPSDYMFYVFLALGLTNEVFDAATARTAEWNFIEKGWQLAC